MRHVGLAFLMLCGAAHADTAIPDPQSEATRFTQVAVTELPRHATLRSVLYLSSHHGCSMSYQSTQDSIELTLKIDGKSAELNASGNSRDVAGGRGSVNEKPHLYHDNNSPIRGRYLGQAHIEGQTLAIDLAPAGKLTCRIRPLKHDSSPAATVSALVCEPAEPGRGIPLSGLAAQLQHLPFGRGAGLQTSANFPQYQRAKSADLPTVTIARL